jgi:tripartite-type tricarboxylate transporter receptor subunit TctC
MARLIGSWLSNRLGQQVVVENRPGAGTNIAVEGVVRAPGDGYTLLLACLPNAINATLYDNLKFNFIRDIMPVAGIARDTFLVAVNPAVPATALAEFIAYARANPGRINMASAGIGSGNHVFGELFKSMIGVNLVHVPYRGAAPALVDLLGGKTQVMFAPASILIEHIRAGRLRALGVLTATRSPQLPDIPAVAEFVPGYEASYWSGLGAPRHTPAEIVESLNREVNAALADPAIKTRLEALDASPMPGSPADFGKLIADETERWGRVIRTTGIKAE